MHNLKPVLLIVGMIVGFNESSAFAQMGMGGMGGGAGRPKSRLHKSRAPALSPSLNLLPEAATTFEGQFLLRQLPQEQALNQYQQTGKALDSLQREMTQTENQIRSGISSTGHSTQFMNYGNFYSFRGGRSGSSSGGTSGGGTRGRGLAAPAGGMGGMGGMGGIGGIGGIGGVGAAMGRPMYGSGGQGR